MSVTAIKEIIKMLENPSLIKMEEEEKEVLENGDIVLKRCEKCGEIIDYIHEGYTMTRDCACMRSYRVQARLKRFQDLSIADRNSKSDIFSNSKKITNAEERAIYEELYNYANNFNISKKGYIFSGGVGTGKTFLANCVCNQLSEKGFSVLSFSLGAYFNKIRFSTDEEEKLIQAVKDVDLLFIDDLGSEYINRENGKMWGEEKLFRLFDERYRTGKPILITTNLDAGEIKEHLKVKGVDKIYDRLKSECKYREFSWESKREVLE